MAHQHERSRGLVCPSLHLRSCVVTDVSINLTTEYGVEKHVELDNLNAKEVEQKIAQLLSV